MTVFYFCPVLKEPTGGTRVIYRHVDILNNAGIPACVVHENRNFRYTTFDNTTEVMSLPLKVTDGDIIVLPEVMNWLLNAWPGIPKVSLIQNAFYMLQGINPLPGNPSSYMSSNDLLACASISAHNQELLEYAFPGNTFQRLHVSIDPAVFHVAKEPPVRRIAYMTRKRPADSRIVLNTLLARGALGGWETLVIDRMSQSAVAAALRSSVLFLSFSEQEGCPLPPLEALASGCSVIGYTGFGGREYFEVPDAVPIPDGDVAAFAHVVEDWIVKFEPEEHWLTAGSRSERALGRYSREQEEADVLAFWRSTLARLPTARAVAHTITRSQVVPRESVRNLLHLSSHYLQAGVRELLSRRA